MTVVPGRHYTLAVQHGERLSEANKRSIKAACREHGLIHDDYLKAYQAAREISRLPAVQAVKMKRVSNFGTWVKGRKA